MGQRARQGLDGQRRDPVQQAGGERVGHADRGHPVPAARLRAQRAGPQRQGRPRRRARRRPRAAGRSPARRRARPARPRTGRSRRSPRPSPVRRPVPTRPSLSRSTILDTTSRMTTPDPRTGWTTLTGARVSATTWSPKPQSIRPKPASQAGAVSSDAQQPYRVPGVDGRQPAQSAASRGSGRGGRRWWRAAPRPRPGQVRSSGSRLPSREHGRAPCAYRPANSAASAAPSRQRR